MRRSIFALLGATALVAGAAVYAQNHAEASDVSGPEGKSSVAVGSLSCNAADGAAVVFGTTRHLDCLFARTDGSAEPYRGAIRRFGTDAGFTGKSHVVWMVFASGAVEPGALAGDYAHRSLQADKGAASSPQMLVSPDNTQIGLEPVHVPGAAGLNVAAGVAEVMLQRGS